MPVEAVQSILSAGPDEAFAICIKTKDGLVREFNILRQRVKAPDRLLRMDQVSSHQSRTSDQEIGKQPDFGDHFGEGKRGMKPESQAPIRADREHGTRRALELCVLEDRDCGFSEATRWLAGIVRFLWASA